MPISPSKPNGWPSPSWHESFYAATRSLVAALALKRKVFRWVQDVVAPTLLLQGDRDRLVPVASARNIASLRPDWEYHEFAGAGHVPMLEVPDEFVEVVSDWLARQGAAVATDAAASGTRVEGLSDPVIGAMPS